MNVNIEDIEPVTPSKRLVIELSSEEFEALEAALGFAEGHDDWHEGIGNDAIGAVADLYWSL